MVLVPLLVEVLHVPMNEAVIASGFVVIANSAATSGHRLRQGMVHLPFAVSLEAAAAATGILGATLALNANPLVLKRVFAVLAAIMAVIMTIFAARERPAAAVAPLVIKRPLLVTAVIALGGMIPGLLGVGGGVVMVPVLNGAGMPLKVATSMSSYVMGAAASAGALVYLTHGLPPGLLLLGAQCVLWTQIGAALGNRLQPRAPQRLLRAMFLAVLAIIAIRMGVS